jgi:HD-GYP domain-containing protein (c-di-GMP phosphodiesterase class II)
MKLVPFSHQYLRADEPLPFGLRDATGQLLLGAGLRLENPARMAELMQQELFADEVESADWTRRLNAAVHVMIRQEARLGQVAAARPEPPRAAGAAVAIPLAEQWQDLVQRLDGALREVRAGSDWRARLLAVHGQARQLYRRRPDASLYQLVFDAAHSREKYSCHHALLTLLVCEETAATLTWPQEQIDSLGRAALTMNVAMVRLQDRLAGSELPPTADARAEIAAHAEKGAHMLEEAGLVDRLCLEVVRLHHTEDPAPLDDALAPMAQHLAQLLHRVDVFCALLSRRGTREALSPLQAARMACLGPGGAPDDIGAALLKAVGLYPPGSFVELVSGEVGIVVARGRRANLPYVAALVSASGNPLGEPMLRDSLDRRHAVKGAVPAGSVKVRPPHERLMAMI